MWQWYTVLFPDNLHTYSLKSLHSTFTRYIKVYINYQKILYSLLDILKLLTTRTTRRLFKLNLNQLVAGMNLIADVWYRKRWLRFAIYFLYFVQFKKNWISFEWTIWPQTVALFTTQIYQQILMLIRILINKQLAMIMRMKMKLGDFGVSPCWWVFTWKVEVGQVHVSTSSAEVIQELEDAFYVEKKKALRHQKCITHRAKVNDSKQYQRKNSLISRKIAITLYLRNIKYDLKLFQRRKWFD